MRSWPLFLALAVSTGCATVPVVTPPPPGLSRHADGIDWGQAGDEAVQLLSAYLQVDTRNPPGNETRGAEFFKAALAKEGIESTIHEFAPGRGSLVARLPATGTPEASPLCLLSHTDVVPAEDAEWPADAQPLSGAVKDGFVWGRGALDMKGMGALELLTLAWLKRANVPLKRDVLLLAVADEEVDNQGMQLVVNTLWDDLKCGTLINEGGIGLQGLLFEGQTVFPITVAEKGTVWLKVVAQGPAGHGSTPMPDRAPVRLRAAMELISNRQPTPTIHPALYELLRRTGEHRGGLTGFILKHPSLVDAFVTGKLMGKPPTRAALTNTCQVTGFEGKGSAPNVIPSEVAAIVDCRVLPGTPPEALIQEIRTLVSQVEGVRVEVLTQEGATESDWNDELFDALVRHLSKGRDDVVVGPAISPGYTDSNLARPKGAKAYGLVPFEIDGELLGTMHGKNERVPVAQVKRGLEVLFRAVVDAAGRP